MKAPDSSLTGALGFPQLEDNSDNRHGHFTQCGSPRHRKMTLRSQPCRQLAHREQEVYMNAEVALGEAFEKAKFAIGAVVVFVIATSLGADYMLASPQELDVMHEAFERCFAV